MFDDDPDDLRIILEVKQHVTYLIHQKWLHVCILEKIVLLDVDLQGLSLPSWVLRVDYWGYLLKDVDLSIQLQFPHQKLAGHVILKVFLSRIGTFDLLPIDIKASFLNPQYLSKDHWFFLQLFLYFHLDCLVVSGCQYVLIVLQWRLIRTIPDLYINFSLA